MLLGIIEKYPPNFGTNPLHFTYSFLFGPVGLTLEKMLYLCVTERCVRIIVSTLLKIKRVNKIFFEWLTSIVL